MRSAVCKWTWSTAPGLNRWLLLVLLAGSGAGHPVPPAQAWKTRIDQFVSDPRFEQAWWGIQVVSASDGAVLYQRNAATLMRPASIAKLFTSALVLDRLGPDYQIETGLYADQPPGPDGTLPGRLVVYGRGDPSFSQRFQPGMNTLAQLAQVVKQAGIQEVEGDLVADETFFWGPRHGAGWTWEDLRQGYGTGVSALSIEDNVLSIELRPAAQHGTPCAMTVSPGWAGVLIENRVLTTSAGAGIPVRAIPQGEEKWTLAGALEHSSGPSTLRVPLRHPAPMFISEFRRELEGIGVPVRGVTRVLSAGAWTNSIDSHPVLAGRNLSPPVAQLLRETLKGSHNLSAQLLFWHAGVRTRGHPFPDPGSAAIEEMKSWLNDAGLPAREILLEDGAGLSRRNLVTPRAVISLLAHLRNGPHAAWFGEALPVAGVDGTLASRFAGGPLQGRVRAKTGTLRHTAALAGWLPGIEDETLLFALFLQNYEPSGEGPSAEQALDALLELIAAPAHDRPGGSFPLD